MSRAIRGGLLQCTVFLMGWRRTSCSSRRLGRLNNFGLLTGRSNIDRNLYGHDVLASIEVLADTTVS